jgi:cephalosporin hydroxylase
MAEANATDMLKRRAQLDTLRSVGFHLSWLKKRRLLARRQQLQSLQDYFKFARKAFKLIQIEKEITGFLSHIQEISPRIVCEIGTKTCGNSFLLSQAIASVELFVGIDLFVENSSQFRAFARPNTKIEFFSGSSYSDEMVERVRKLLAGRKIDVLFVDGDHRYEGAKSDFLLYRQFVRDGGIIAFHDVMPVRAALPGEPPTLWAGDVPVLWEKVKAGYPYREFVGKPDQNGLGIGAITYSAAAPVPQL